MSLTTVPIAFLLWRWACSGKSAVSEKVFEHPSRLSLLSSLPLRVPTELLLPLISLLDQPSLRLSTPYDDLLYPWPT